MKNINSTTCPHVKLFLFKSPEFEQCLQEVALLMDPETLTAPPAGGTLLDLGKKHLNT